MEDCGVSGGCETLACLTHTETQTQTRTADQGVEAATARWDSVQLMQLARLACKSWTGGAASEGRLLMARATRGGRERGEGWQRG